MAIPHPQSLHTPTRPPPIWGGGLKQGRFVILPFPLFCSVRGSQDTQTPGKQQEKCHCRTRMLAGKAQEKRQIDPILLMYYLPFTKLLTQKKIPRSYFLGDCDNFA